MSDQAEAERLITALVSRRSGVITGLARQARGPDEPSPPHLWTATMAHYGFAAATPAMRLTGGKGLTEAQAQLSAIGEALERYAAMAWDTARLKVSTPPENAIEPTEFVLYSPAQHAAGCPFQPYDPSTAISWIDGFEVGTDAPVHLPAALVYLVSAPPGSADFFTSPTSSGLAAGPDLTAAVLGGAQEVIERDAFMITWLNRLPATLIASPDSGCRAAPIIRHYDRFGVKVSLLLLPTDQAPYVVMAVADDANGPVARMIGLGCDLDPARAVDKAVFELCQLRPGMIGRMGPGSRAAQLHGYSDVRTMEDHAMFHALPAQAAEFDFLTSEGASCTLDDLEDRSTGTAKGDLARITETAATSGVRFAYADITPDDTAPLGPRVVRVLGTGLQPIHFGHDQARLGHTRLFEAPVRWGLRDVPLDEAALNSCPHPLA